MPKLTYNECLRVARNRKILRDFREKDARHYRLASRRGWLPKLIQEAGLNRERLTQGHWNIYKNCLKEARKCRTASQLKEHCPSAHCGAQRNGWLRKLAADVPFDQPQAAKGSVTLSVCKTEAAKHNSIRDFRQAAPNIYQKAYAQGWLGKITKHMEKLGSKKARKLYAFEFEDGSA